MLESKSYLLKMSVRFDIEWACEENEEKDYTERVCNENEEKDNT